VKRALIVGGGGFGREVLAWLDDARRATGGFEISGFLDSKNVPSIEGLPIIADPADFEPGPDDLLVCAIGDPRGKLSVVERLSARGGRWLTLVHPTARVGPGCEIGEGSVLCPGVVLTTRVILGSVVVINVYSTVGHDASLGDGCTLSAHCDVTGKATLGRGVFMGSHAVVIPGVYVEEFATIGAGSVATKRVPRGCTVLGVPARRIWGPVE
jgi:sugar O-acyltransferase (sialic acid O-acetyltransferase NeuD family)